MSRELHTRLQSEYVERREQALSLAEDREAEAYNAVDGLREIDLRIVRLGIDAAKKVLEEPGRAGEISQEVQGQIRILKKKKAEMLTAHGYPADFVEPKFQCSRCEDTGVLVGGKGSSWCSCYRQRLIDGLFEESGLARDRMATFEKSNEDLFSDEIDEKRFEIKNSPRENYRNIKERAISFVNEGFYQQGGKGLLFTGHTGTGKTWMAECIAHELIIKGKTVAFVSAAAMFDKINEEKLASYGDESQETYFGLLKEADLLIIDDLGTETISEAKLSNLLQLLNVRSRLDQMSPHKTIISTNLSLGEIRDRYDDRVLSRIIGGFLIFKFGGEDLRIITRRMAK